MEYGPLEDLFPIENGEIPASFVSLAGGSIWEGVFTWRYVLQESDHL